MQQPMQQLWGKMRKPTEGPSRTFAVGALAAMLALAGCGNSGAGSHPTSTTASPGRTSTATERARKSPITLAISAIGGTGEGHLPIPARYTCDGANISPALRWGKVPVGTRELVLFIAHLSRGEFHFDWSVAGLKPALGGLAAGSLPAGAVVGRGSHGQSAYSVCPTKGVKQSYGVVLLAMPHRTGAHAGFQITELADRGNREAIGEGQFGFSYERH
jgi:phosphatidylethanolamine-binding protein (PEBP) family uncharacterized protein